MGITRICKFISLFGVIVGLVACTDNGVSTPTVSDEDDLSSAMAQITETFEYTSPTDIGLMARFHFATQTKDFDTARAFYRMLGYTEGIGGFPLTNTHQMARALGMFDECQYELVKGEVISLPSSQNVANIDLLQFKTPFNPDPPYELPNHLGMAYAGLLTTSLDEDVAFLQSRGVELLSPPFGEIGSRYVFFRDPEGVLFKLMESSAPISDGSDAMHLTAMPYIGINVSDLDASLEFYARFGYTQVTPIEQTGGGTAEARAWGLESDFQFKGADIALDRGDRHVLRLIQWLEPFDPEPAYPPPVNHIGINRIALMVPDLDRAVAILKAQNVPFLSEPAPCCSGTSEDESAIVHAIDPDGVFLELVGGISKRPPQPHPAHCPPMEIKMPPAPN